jgi:hypothetical protein
MGGTHESKSFREGSLRSTDGDVLAGILDLGELDGAAECLEDLVCVRADEESVLALIDAHDERLGSTFLQIDVVSSSL